VPSARAGINQGKKLGCDLPTKITPAVGGGHHERGRHGVQRHWGGGLWRRERLRECARVSCAELRIVRVVSVYLMLLSLSLVFIDVWNCI